MIAHTKSLGYTYFIYNSTNGMGKACTDNEQALVGTADFADWNIYSTENATVTEVAKTENVYCANYNDNWSEAADAATCSTHV